MYYSNRGRIVFAFTTPHGKSRGDGMRWPIQIQILLPMVAIVLLATGAASLGSAYLGGLRP